MSGKVFKYGDNVNTDVIIPARYLNDASAENLRAHAMEDIDREFAKRVQPGDFVSKRRVLPRSSQRASRASSSATRST